MKQEILQELQKNIAHPSNSHEAWQFHPPALSRVRKGLALEALPLYRPHSASSFLRPVRLRPFLPFSTTPLIATVRLGLNLILHSQASWGRKTLPPARQDINSSPMPC